MVNEDPLFALSYLELKWESEGEIQMRSKQEANDIRTDLKLTL